MSRRCLASGAAVALALAATLATFATLAAFAAPAAAQTRDWSKVELKVAAVAGPIHMIEGAGGNIGVCVGPDGVFMVDDQFAPLTDRIVAEIHKLSDRPIRFLLNTHWHGDHTGGNENLGKAGVLIVAHDNVRKTMSADQVTAMGGNAPASPPGSLPVVTFSDSVRFHMNGEEVHAFHVPPAHTDGDALVHFKRSNVIHSGDLVFIGRYPVIDGPHGGSLDGMIAATELVIAMCDDKTRVIPGHGSLTDRAGVQRFHDMLVEVRGRLAKLAAEGKTLDEVKAAKPLADLDAEWGAGRGSDGFLQMAYPTLKKP